MADEASTAELLAAVKRRLRITWDDAGTDQDLREMIGSGMAYLNDKYGAAADYSAAGEPRTLLMEYVRYARDYALDVFETNYANRILGMQNNRRVAAYVENTVPAGESDQPDV